MRRIGGLAMLLLLILAVALRPSFADDVKKDPPAQTKDDKDKKDPPKDEKKKDDKDDKDKKAAAAKAEKDKKAAKEKMARTETLIGKLTQVEGAQRYLTVQVTKKVPQQNTGAMQNIANLKMQLIGNRDVNSIRNIYVEIAKNQAQLVSYKDENQNFELQADDELKVRTMLLPVEYDDKGKPRKLTPKELKELKGADQSLPGYDADFDSLKTGQNVRAYVARPKDAGKLKPKDKDAAVDAKDRPRVVMVVILSEPAK